MKLIRNLSFLCLVFSILSSTVLISACQKNPETLKNKVATEAQAKYFKYIQGLWNSLTALQKEALTSINSASAEGGIAQNSLSFRQEDIDRLIQLRLVKSSGSDRKYVLSSLGEDIFKLNANVDLPKTQTEETSANSKSAQ